MDGEIFVSGKKKLRIQKYPDTCGLGLRDIKPCFTVYFFDIEPPCYDQLTPVKTGYPLTSIT